MYYFGQNTADIEAKVGTKDIDSGQNHKIFGTFSTLFVPYFQIKLPYPSRMATKERYAS